jgi:gamma-glutamyltranspeptidase / glutathione hydrolase / leukotriene-C4 hydrolase
MFKRPGMKVIPKRQCEFLEILANHTKTNIYADGLVIDLIVGDFDDAGSAVTRNDFKEYKVKWSESIEYAMTDNYSLFVPNTAAVLVPAVINILKQYQFNASSLDSENNVNETILTHHRIAEALKHVFAARPQHGDPDYIFVKEIVTQLLSPEYAKHVKNRIDDATTFTDSEKYSAKFTAPNNDGTSHISIIAPNGDAISVTSSINY